MNYYITYFLVCQHYMDGYPIVLDLTWQNPNWIKLYQTSQLASLPYFKLDITIGPTLRILDDYLKLRNATDVTVILKDQSSMYKIFTIFFNTIL